MLHDLARLTGVLEQAGVFICADCVISLGATPLDLTSLDLARRSSGMTLGAFCGIATEFASTKVLD